MIDPLIDLTLRGLLSALFAWSAIHKLRDLPAFSQVVRGYEVLPVAGAPLAAGVFPVVELMVAGGLLAPVMHFASSVAAAALLLVYSVAIGANLARGRRDVDCGCFGPARRQPLSEWLLVRNGVLCAGAAVVGLPVGSRSLTSVDVVSAVAACASLTMLWMSANQLVSQWPRMHALRRPS